MKETRSFISFIDTSCRHGNFGIKIQKYKSIGIPEATHGPQNNVCHNSCPYFVSYEDIQDNKGNITIKIKCNKDK